MMHSSDAHYADSNAAPGSARVVPFERPPTNLQRAVRERAQEALELERERTRPQPAPLRRVIIFLLALVPVAVVVAGVDAIVRAFQIINEQYSNMPEPQPEPVEQVEQQEPGIVFLQPLAEDPPRDEARPAQ